MIMGFLVGVGVRWSGRGHPAQLGTTFSPRSLTAASLSIRGQHPKEMRCKAFLDQHAALVTSVGPPTKPSSIIPG